MSDDIEQATTRLLPTRLVCKRYDICNRTLIRWERDPDLRFPEPIVIKTRKYYRDSDLTAWDRANAGRRTAA